MLKLKHLPVRTQLLLTFGALCAILMAIGAMLFFGLRSAERSNRLHQVRSVTKLALIDDVSQDVGQMQAGVLRQVLALDPGEIKSLDHSVRDIGKTNISEFTDYREFIDTIEEKDLYARVLQTRRAYWEQTQKVLALGLIDHDDEARKLINSDQAPAYDKFLKAVGELTKHAENEANGAIAATACSISEIRIIGDVLIGAAILIVIGAGYLVGAVTRRLNQDNERLQTEIKERKQAEGKLRESEECFSGAFEHASMGMALVLPEGSWFKVNRALCNLVGYTETELLARTFRDITHPDDIERDVLGVGRLLAGEVHSYHSEKRYIHARGDIVTVLLNISLIHDRHGEPRYLIAQMQDITERKKAEAERERVKQELSLLNAELEQRVALRTEALFAATQEAERANRAKSEFLSRISHELRTPLNAILGFGQLLEMEGRTLEEADNIGQILKAAHHLLDLVNEVLDISGLEAGKVGIHIQSLDANDVINDALMAARPLAAERDVTLGAVVCESRVLIDRQRFQQALLHLIFNAIKYNRRGGRVTFAAKETAGFLRLTITDTGPGIAPADTARIFTAFERLSVMGKVDGMGLGLTISRRLVEMMGGRIGVESAPGEGSTFWVEVPLAENPRARAGQEGEPSLFNAESNSVNCRTLLYIEDNLANLRLITRILARRPAVQLLSAGTLELGLEMAREHHPDLILVDMRISDRRGEHLLAALRADSGASEIPVVILTAEDSPEKSAWMLAAGAYAIIAEPVEVRTLLGILDQVLGFPPE